MSVRATSYRSNPRHPAIDDELLAPDERRLAAREKDDRGRDLVGGPRSILAQGFGIHTYATGPVEDVEVVLSEPWATFALTHRWHPTQRAMRLEGGRTRVTLQVRLCRELETWALGFGEHARVMRPERLADIIASRLKTAADTYRPPRALPALAKARRQPAEHPRRKRAT